MLLGQFWWVPRWTHQQKVRKLQKDFYLKMFIWIRIVCGHISTNEALMPQADGKMSQEWKAGATAVYNCWVSSLFSHEKGRGSMVRLNYLRLTRDCDSPTPPPFLQYTACPKIVIECIVNWGNPNMVDNKSSIQFICIRMNEFIDREVSVQFAGGNWQDNWNSDWGRTEGHRYGEGGSWNDISSRYENRDG